jgi:hypothetical protein
MDRKQLSESQIEKAVELTIDKLNYRLTQKGAGTFASRHEILGVITEEYNELVGASHGKDHGRIVDELLDIAVGCIFAVACLNENTVDW